MLNKTILFSVFAMVLIMTSSGGCAPAKKETGVLQPVEVRDYQGQKLSSVNDMRENSISGPQNIDIKTYRLEFNGLVENPRIYTYDEVINSYRHYNKVMTLNCVEGWSATILWQGILMKDLIANARPRPEAKVVIFHAQDGYTTSHTLDYLVSRDILLAYMMNDAPIPPERGFPFVLVAESKWGYKWCKWITRIELSDDVNYRGYWEDRGYSNTGDLDKNFFD